MGEKIKVSIKTFLFKNTGILKAVRTLVEVIAAWFVSMLPQWLAGWQMNPEIQVAVIGVIAAIIAGIVNEIGEKLGVADE